MSTCGLIEKEAYEIYILFIYTYIVSLSDNSNRLLNSKILWCSEHPDKPFPKDQLIPKLRGS